MSTLLRKITELALLRSIPGNADAHNMKNCRFKSLYLSLEKEVDKELAFMPRLPPKTVAYIEEAINKFGDSTNWRSKPKHFATIVSFCLEILEHSEFTYSKRIFEILADIIEHFENGKDYRLSNCWAGSIAAEKWNKVMNEYEL